LVYLLLISVNYLQGNVNDHCEYFFNVSLTVNLSISLANDQLDAQILIHLLQSSTCTCFEQ